MSKKQDILRAVAEEKRKQKELSERHARTSERATAQLAPAQTVERRNDSFNGRNFSHVIFDELASFPNSVFENALANHMADAIVYAADTNEWATAPNNSNENNQVAETLPILRDTSWRWWG